MSTISSPESTRLNFRLTRYGYFFAAVLFHLVLFMMVGTLIIFQAPAPPMETSFQRISLPKPPPPPVPSPSSSGGETANNLEPDVTVTPPPAVLSAISTSFSTTHFSLPSAKLPKLSSISNHPVGSALAGQGSPGSDSGNGNPFGSSSATTSGLFQGYLYDLKQTADRKPTGMTSEQYRTILSRLLLSGWNESILAPYYKSPKPLFISQILIPDMDANAGPKAFDAQNEVEPKLWIVWYKARLAPPKTGAYRFAGFADDVLLVRVDGETVLDGSIAAIAEHLLRHTPWPNDWVENRLADQNYGQLREGTPVGLTEGIAVDIDVIVGEDPGGQFNASLFAVRDGDNYPTDKGGEPMLPLLQAGTSRTQFDGAHPPIDPNTALWSR